MNIDDCIDAAERNLYDARRYLESGEAVNWVPDSLSTALLRAMEAWLMAHGHKWNRGQGWEGLRSAFIDVAPEKLRSEVMYCLGKATFLEYDLEGGFEHKEPILPLKEWKKEAYECLEKMEKVVRHLLADTRLNILSKDK
jgi:hypothetical protein